MQPHDHPRREYVAHSASHLEGAAALFDALADPGRLRVLDLLLRGEACVSEIAETLGLELPLVSQRLRVLRQAHLVQSRREGRHVWYAVADDHVLAFVNAALSHAAHVGDR